MPRSPRGTPGVPASASRPRGRPGVGPRRAAPRTEGRGRRRPPAPRGPERLVFEIGTEELPPRAAWEGARRLRDDAAAAFEAARLATAAVRAYSTPRRLVLIVEQVAPRQADLVREVRGPAARAAFAPDGKPTAAAEGFARAQGVPVAALERRAGPQGEYVYAVRREPGAPAPAALADLLPRLAAGLEFPKPMRWRAGAVRFARPVRWLVALLGARVVPCEFAGVRAGRRTRGHRTLHPGPVRVPSADAYETVLRRASVLLDPEERRRLIVDGAMRAAAGTGGRPITDPDLLAETVQLVERPEAFAGRFADEFLALPREVLITVMQHHQKYFAVEDASGRLLPAFVAVRNGDARGLATVREGNEWVLRARLADARFFFEEDRKRPLAARVADLGGLVFLERLGTMAQKVKRLERLAERFAGPVGMAPAAARALSRAAHLSKADLVTQMVRELPELQGVVGGLYAALDGEADGVADAIREQYLPRGEALPGSDAGAALSLLDKMDTVAGALTVGMAPSGSQDPYGLRRAANGIVAILLNRGWRVPVGRLAFDALDAHGVADPAARRRLADETLGILRQRLRSALIEEGLSYDTVDAALGAAAVVSRSSADSTVAVGALPQDSSETARAAGGPGGAAPPPFPADPDDFIAAAARADALAAFRQTDAFARTYTAFDRAARIVPKGFADDLREDALAAPAERALHEAVNRIAPAVADCFREARRAEVAPDDRRVPVRSAAAEVQASRRAAAPDGTAAGRGPGRRTRCLLADAYRDALARAAALAEPVDRLFTDVLVMDPDEAVRANRLALLVRVVAVIRPLADLSRAVVGEGKTAAAS